jgi:hypothetical protein
LSSHLKVPWRRRGAFKTTAATAAPDETILSGDENEEQEEQGEDIVSTSANSP